MFKRRHHFVAVAILGIILLLVSVSLYNTRGGKITLPPDVQGVMIEDPSLPMPAFSLNDQNGKAFSNAQLHGRWTLMFFGYTSCPDICPNTMRVFHGISQRAQTPADTQYVFISLDPKRDTEAKIKDYMAFFNPKFIGLRGEKEAIDQLTQPLGVVYEIDYEGEEESDDYLVNHFAAIYVVDPDGELIAYILPPHNVERVGGVFDAIVKQY